MLESAKPLPKTNGKDGASHRQIYGYKGADRASRETGQFLLYGFFCMNDPALKKTALPPVRIHCARTSQRLDAFTVIERREFRQNTLAVINFGTFCWHWGFFVEWGNPFLRLQHGRMRNSVMSSEVSCRSASGTC